MSKKWLLQINVCKIYSEIKKPKYIWTKLRNFGICFQHIFEHWYQTFIYERQSIKLYSKLFMLIQFNYTCGEWVSLVVVSPRKLVLKLCRVTKYYEEDCGLDCGQVNLISVTALQCVIWNYFLLVLNFLFSKQEVGLNYWSISCSAPGSCLVVINKKFSRSFSLLYLYAHCS